MTIYGLEYEYKAREELVEEEGGVRVIDDAGIPAQVLCTSEAAAAGRMSKCLSIHPHRTYNLNKIVDNGVRVNL